MLQRSTCSLVGFDPSICVTKICEVSYRKNVVHGKQISMVGRKTASCRFTQWERKSVFAV
jgi:hypothetical protein